MLALGILVLLHVNVIDVVRGAVLHDRAVEIERGKIRAVLPEDGYSPPRGSTLLDLRGRYLTPGFIDMHVHVLFPPTDDDGRALPAYDRATSLQLLRDLLAYGVTTVRDTGDATEAVVAVRTLLARGEIRGPNLLTAGRILNTGSFHHAIYVPVNTENEVREEVAWQARVGVNFIKVYADMPPNLVRAAIEEARTYGIPVIGHLQATTWTAAARMGISAICHAAPWAPEYLPENARAAYQPSIWGRVFWLEHMDLSSSSIQEMVATLTEMRVAVDPTLMAFRTKFWGDDPRYIHNVSRSLAPARLWAGWPQRSSTVDWTAVQYAAAKAPRPGQIDVRSRCFADCGHGFAVSLDYPGSQLSRGTEATRRGRHSTGGSPPDGDYQWSRCFAARFGNWYRRAGQACRSGCAEGQASGKYR